MGEFYLQICAVEVADRGWGSLVAFVVYLNLALLWASVAVYGIAIVTLQSVPHPIATYLLTIPIPYLKSALAETSTGNGVQLISCSEITEHAVNARSIGDGRYATDNSRTIMASKMSLSALADIIRVIQVEVFGVTLYALS